MKNNHVDKLFDCPKSDLTFEDNDKLNKHT